MTLPRPLSSLEGSGPSQEALFLSPWPSIRIYQHLWCESWASSVIIWYGFDPKLCINGWTGSSLTWADLSDVSHLGKKLVLRWVTFTQTWCLLHEASSDSPNTNRVSSCRVSWGPVSVPAMGPHHPLPYMNQDFRYTSCVLFSSGCFCFVLFALVEEAWSLLLLSPCHITILGQHRALILLINILFYSYSLLSFPSRHRSLFYCGNGHLHLNVFLQNVHCWFIHIYFKSLCERYYAWYLILCPYLCIVNVVLCDI